MIIPKDYNIKADRGGNTQQGVHKFDEPYYEFQLRITDYCNYDCEYCHWKYGHHYNIDDIENTITSAIDCIDHTNFRIYFHGGEPTTHPKCRDVIKFIFNMNKSVIVELQTNLSVGHGYIQELIDDHKDNKLDINVSYHHKYTKDFKKFIDKIDMIDNAGMLGKVDVMLEHDEESKNDIIDNSKQMLTRPYKNKIEFIHSYIDYRSTTDMYSDFVNEHAMFHEEYEVTYQDGTIKTHDTNDLYREGISFEGWTCSVGKEYIIINGNGDYFMCCANTLEKPIGNILDNKALFKIRANNYTKCKWSCCKGEFYIPKKK